MPSAVSSRGRRGGFDRASLVVGMAGFEIRGRICRRIGGSGIRRQRPANRLRTQRRIQLAGGQCRRRRSGSGGLIGEEERKRVCRGAMSCKSIFQGRMRTSIRRLCTNGSTETGRLPDRVIGDVPRRERQPTAHPIPTVGFRLLPLSVAGGP